MEWRSRGERNSVARTRTEAVATQFNSNRERELLEKRQRNWRELQRRHNADFTVDAAALHKAEAHNSELEDELENAPGLLEENMDENKWLHEIVESHGGRSANESTSPEGCIELGVSRRVGKIAKLPGSKMMSVKLPIFR